MTVFRRAGRCEPFGSDAVGGGVSASASVKDDEWPNSGLLASRWSGGPGNIVEEQQLLELARGLLVLLRLLYK